MKQMRVLLADRQHRVLSAIKLLLEQDPDLMVAGEVHMPGELLKQAQAMRPDLLLLDWGLSTDVLNIIQSVKGLRPRPFVVVLSGRIEDRNAALEAGADFFVSKGDPPEELTKVIDRVRKSA